MPILVRGILDDVGDAFAGAGKALGGSVADAAKSIVDQISDAGHAIGSVLKFVAPIISLWPGIGTAVGIALEAAAAYACGDKIDEAIIEIGSAAIPGGAPRVMFNGAADVVEAFARGENLKEATFRAMRSAAQSTGGERAAAAFDAGLAVARGAKVSDGAFRLARSQAQQGGVTELAAFDAAVAVANGGDGKDALIAAARDYAAASGGPLAAAAYDAGIALAQGKSLQEAGFAALKAFSAGNDLSERAEDFLEKVVRARREGRSVLAVAEDELAADVARYGDAAVRSGAVASVQDFVAAQLGRVLDRYVSPDWDAWGSFALAEALGVAEPIARAAQAIMRRGEPDRALFDRLTTNALQGTIKKFGLRTVASEDLFTRYVAQRSQDREALLLSALRLPSYQMSYALEQSRQGVYRGPPPPPPVEPAWHFETSASSSQASPRHSLASDLALGGVVGAAAVALFFWAKS